MYSDVMLDIETLGTAPGSVVTSVGLVFFNRTDPEGAGLATNRWTLDIRPQLKAGLRIDGDTLYWWLRQEREAVISWSGDAHREPPAVALDSIRRTIQEHAAGARIWANSPSFDCVLMESLFRVFGVYCPWKYNQQADIRTLLLTAPVDKVEPTLAHDAASDAQAQARTVQRAWASLGLRPTRTEY